MPPATSRSRVFRNPSVATVVDPVFMLIAAHLPLSLSLREDHYPHALLEPAIPCLLADYESALTGTRVNWSRAS